MPRREERLRREARQREREAAAAIAAKYFPPPSYPSPAPAVPAEDAASLLAAVSEDPIALELSATVEVVDATKEEDPGMSSPPETPMFWIRFSIPGLGYMTYHGTNYDRGQLLPMSGGPRDEQLQRMGYVAPASQEEAHLRAQCGVCGCWFLTESFRDMHGRLRHSERFQPELDIGGGMQGPDGGAALRDVTGDAEERRMQNQYPLYLERTKATLESSPA